MTGLGAWILGRADSAPERIARAVAFARDTKYPYDLAMAPLFEGYLHGLQREPRQSKALIEQLAFSSSCPGGIRLARCLTGTDTGNEAARMVLNGSIATDQCVCHGASG